MKLNDEDRMSVRATAWMAEARRTYRRFEQDKVWADANGEEWNIEQLETSHLLHIIPFLEKRAQRLAYLHGLGAAQLTDGPLGPTPGSQAEVMVEEQLQEMWELQMQDPLQWLRSTPLMKRLYREKWTREYRALSGGADPVREREATPMTREQKLADLLDEVLDLMNRRVWFPYELRNRIKETLNEPRR